MIANKYCICSGKGKSKEGLPSFDKALIDAGVGNYNLVRLSSILPAKCELEGIEGLIKSLPEGSLLPTAYSTITSDAKGETIASAIGVGIPKDREKIGVIMEYSSKNESEEDAVETLCRMIEEAFEVRGWELGEIKSTSISDTVEEEGTKHTTFCCIAEW